MDFVHHTRMVHFAQVNDVDAARSCSNHGTLRNWTAGQTSGLKQPQITTFRMWFFSYGCRDVCVFSWGFPLSFQMSTCEAVLFCLDECKAVNLTSVFIYMIPRRSPCGDHSCSFPHRFSDCRQQESNASKSWMNIKHTITMHCYSWARQILYQTNIFVSAQHRWCHKVAARNPREPDQFIWLVWLQHKEVSLERKRKRWFY